MKIQIVFIFWPLSCIRAMHCVALDNICNSIGFIHAMLLETVRVNMAILVG